jgi:hypothetical protein
MTFCSTNRPRTEIFVRLKQWRHGTQHNDIQHNNMRAIRLGGHY